MGNISRRFPADRDPARLGLLAAPRPRSPAGMPPREVRPVGERLDSPPRAALMIDHRKSGPIIGTSDSIGIRRNRNPNKGVSPIGPVADKGRLGERSRLQARTTAAQTLTVSSPGRILGIAGAGGAGRPRRSLRLRRLRRWAKVCAPLCRPGDEEWQHG
jgi:hypothetical protein